MKFRVTVVEPDGAARGASRDVLITADVTVTVGQVARSLVRAGVGEARLRGPSLRMFAPLTLRTAVPGEQPAVLVSTDAIGESGLRSGAIIEPVLEADPRVGRRTRPPFCSLTVVEGTQRGVMFLAFGDECLVGRDPACQVRLLDSEVSRRHAVLRSTPEGIEIEDLGSVNGTEILEGEVLDHPHKEGVVLLPAGGPTTVEFGTVKLRIQSLLSTDVLPPAEVTVLRLQSPKVESDFRPEPIELPAPPDLPEKGKFPLVAMVAPLLMGSVMYAVTQSIMSLIFVGLSPLIMLGTWLDALVTGRRKHKTDQADYQENLKQAQNELYQNRQEEQVRRRIEAPTPEQVLDLASTLDSSLWSRRPEHGWFLECRLGEATLPSRKSIELPARGSIPADKWAEVVALRDEHADVPGVPLVETLDSCGSLGVAGSSLWLSDIVRALVVQIVGLHSPADVVLTAFAAEADADDEWAWLKWLPHVDSAFSPLPVPHLASDSRSADALLNQLESLITQRRNSTQGSPSGTARGPGLEGVGERTATPQLKVPHPRVVVLVLDPTLVDLPRLVAVAEEGADYGVHAIWVAPEIQDVPAACRTTVVAHSAGAQVHFVRRSLVVPLSRLDLVGRPQADAFARALAPVVDAGARVIDESDFPRVVTLDKLVTEDLLGSWQAVTERWVQTDSLTSAWTVGNEREDRGLVGVVGQGSGGAVEIDLRTHGPHALVGGTTGSGKSEFLQTWILSLAATYSPDRLTFLLVDYKGGAAFADCVGLPHTVGLVTDLNMHLVRRALASLRAELRWREELLSRKGAKDLLTLEARSDPEAPPTLVIVIDEFAALVNEVPEFVDGVIDVAQRGRSLGLHLIMATQRPAGVIKDNLRANTNLRVALRMADEADSADVIGTKDAATFSPDIPGRAVLKVGAGQLTHFQTAYLGGHHERAAQEDVEIAGLRFGAPRAWPLDPDVDASSASASGGPRDIELLAANITRASEEAGLQDPRRPWVDQLPDLLPLASLLKTSDGAQAGSVLVGMVDEPDMQRQSPYFLPLSESGNVVIYGGPGTGKTGALITCVVSAVTQDVTTTVYGIDMGGGRLSVLRALPNVGEIVPGDDRSRIIRLLGVVKAIVDSRLADADSTKPCPMVLLLIDGIAAFREEYEFEKQGQDPFADLLEIARTGRTVGVHLLMTSERSGGLPTALAAVTPERLTLRLPSETDYQSIGASSAALEDAGAGRVIRVGSDQEIQWAWAADTLEPEDLEAELSRLASEVEAAGAPSP